jgi:hypothetical protein
MWPDISRVRLNTLTGHGAAAVPALLVLVLLVGVVLVGVLLVPVAVVEVSDAAVPSPVAA